MRIGTTRLNLRAVTGLSATFGLALTLASWPAAAPQDPEATRRLRTGCDGLCKQYISDVQRVSVCMSHYRRYAAC
jgi:hypothetical protein